ncbi:hypothetical protein FRB99_008973 [Tulasnella sp. 403]|nr:hypothetical protein FRB99_008973 [Tulasnella sp. 403]
MTDAQPITTESGPTASPPTLTTQNPPQSKKPRKPTTSKPSEILPFSLTIPHLKAGPPSRSQPLTNPLTLALAYDVVHYLDLEDTVHSQTHYALIHPEERELDPDLDPVFLRLDADAPPPDSEGGHVFWFDTGSSVAPEVLRQLVDLDVLAFTEPRRYRKPEDWDGEGEGSPLVRVVLPEKQLAKRCGQCAIWEQRTDQERLAICGRCKLAWYCDDQCQLQSWKSGESTPHKKVCKKLAAQLTQ